MFTGNGSNTIALVTFFANGVGTIFNSLDDIQFLDAPFSILDVFIAVILWRLITWYILRIITGKDTDTEGYSLTEEEKYKQYGETLKSSATEDELDFSESSAIEDELDFSEEIVHE